MKYCKVYDCSKAENKCQNCEFKDICDFVWISEIWKKNSSLLTPLMPGWVKPEFKANHVITISGKYDFCIFNNPKKKDTITIQDICVAEEGRGQGLSKQLINNLMEAYDKDIIAKCVKGSSAESFWSHLGVKIGEEPSKQRSLSIYLVENKNKKFLKEDLF